MLNIFRKNKDIINKIEYKNYLIRVVFLIIFTFSYAFIYNLFLVPNHIVVGGMSGLAIVIKKITGLSTSTFMYITTFVLVILYYLVFGKKKTINTLIGSILFTLMVSFTEPIAKLISINFNNKLIMLVFTGILYGISSGMIYRAGFNTGGSDIIASIISKYAKTTIGTSGKIINSLIILCGAVVFGFSSAIYAVIILVISSKMVDIVMLGINDSKMCFVSSKKWNVIKEEIPVKLSVGVTEIINRISIFKKDNTVLLIIVPFHSYNYLKDEIMKIDDEAFITTVDCYNVLGGYKKSILPF